MENQINLTKVKLKLYGKVFCEFYQPKATTVTRIRPRKDKDQPYNALISGPSCKNILILRDDAAKTLHTVWI